MALEEYEGGYLTGSRGRSEVAWGDDAEGGNTRRTGAFVARRWAGGRCSRWVADDERIPSQCRGVRET